MTMHEEAMQAGVLPNQPAYPVVGPQPTNFSVAAAQGPDGRKYVLLQFAHAAGLSFFMLPEEAAKSLRDAITQATSGLLLGVPEMQDQMQNGTWPDLSSLRQQ